MTAMNADTKTRLMQAAVAARARAYAPYSKFSVGAALLSTDGTIFSGCNVENASYGLTVCAERVAIGAAVVAGHRTFSAIAVCADPPASPCGACRQVLVEFNPDMPVLLVGADGQFSSETTAAALLPGFFRLEEK